MKKITRIVCSIGLFCVLLSCIGCVNSDIDIEINKDGSAYMSMQTTISEELYNTLKELKSTSEDDRTPDLNDYVEEPPVDGKIYYTYTSEKKEYATYSELAYDLRNMKIISGAPLLDTITIENNKNINYCFYIKTMEFSSDVLKKETGLDTIPDDWLTVTLTVSMPGEINDIQCGDGVEAEQLDENTVRYTIRNFTEAQTCSVRSFSSDSSFITFAIIGVVICCVIVVLIFSLGKNKKEENKEE